MNSINLYMLTRIDIENNFSLYDNILVIKILSVKIRN